MIGLFLWVLFLIIYAFVVFPWWWLLLVVVVSLLAASHKNKRRFK